MQCFCCVLLGLFSRKLDYHFPESRRPVVWINVVCGIESNNGGWETTLRNDSPEEAFLAAGTVQTWARPLLKAAQSQAELP